MNTTTERPTTPARPRSTDAHRLPGAGRPRPPGSGGADRRALLLESVDPRAAHRLREAGWEVETCTQGLSGKELTRRLEGVQLLGIRSGTSLDADTFAAASELEAVGAFCIGTNQIDLAAAAQRGIAVFNAPFSSTRSVVELALTEIIALTRNLTATNDSVHHGRWHKTSSGSHEVRGRCLGIIGYGNIGSQLSVLAESLGMRVVFFDVADRLALGTAHACGSLEELLAEADVVTVHVDGRAGNAGLFGQHEFAHMRDGAVFLNLSRGFVADEQALVKHLESGHLAGAAVDVFADEPHHRDSEFSSPLQGRPNVILTPHVAGSTEEAQQDIGSFVAGKLIAYTRGGDTTLCANLPALAAPQPPRALRLGHLHRNAPGVLAAINQVLAEHEVNVDQQSLATAGDIGYALIDVDACSPTSRARLAELPSTLAVRDFGATSRASVDQGAPLAS